MTGKRRNGMKNNITSPAVVAAAIILDAWREDGASFERLCLKTGPASLAVMSAEGTVRANLVEGSGGGP